MEHTGSPTSTITNPSPLSPPPIEKMGVNPKHPDYISPLYHDHDVNDNNHDPNTNTTTNIKKHCDHIIQQTYDIMDHAKIIMEQWNCTIMPTLYPKAKQLLHDANDIWKLEQQEFRHQEQEKNEIQKQKHNDDGKEEVVQDKDDESKPPVVVKEIHTKYEHIWDHIIQETIDMQQQVQQIHDELVHCKEQINHALQVDPICTKYLNNISRLPIFGTPYRQDQKDLHHYYTHQFLPYYETAMTEYHELNQYPSGILQRILNMRKYELEIMKTSNQKKEHKSTSSKGVLQTMFHRHHHHPKVET